MTISRPNNAKFLVNLSRKRNSLIGNRSRVLEVARLISSTDFCWNVEEEKLKTEGDDGIRHCLEGIYQLMLLIWCRETQALRKLHARRCGT